MYTSKGRRIATPNKPVVGSLYDMELQHEMHGGAPQKCAPIKDGDFTLLRLIPEHNADAPYIVDWESSNDPKVRQIQEQTQEKPLPVYVRWRANGWEYMGQFGVAHVATDRPTLAEREARAGHTVSYAIHLEKS
jgi:hypothetical protein